ncbi:hypothetical protein TSUD_217690 [Trifolium subterraneum]|uniref:Uncharacterized protein n=1 Tax=Trifolium subterraneum TaxID=3900 RepID=A0A2Z6NJB8_TRISU|nr:hypothetical protein TSUD_217690 [Trifolium subterraneum]
MRMLLLGFHSFSKRKISKELKLVIKSTTRKPTSETHPESQGTSTLDVAQSSLEALEKQILKEEIATQKLKQEAMEAQLTKVAVQQKEMTYIQRSFGFRLIADKIM